MKKRVIFLVGLFCSLSVANAEPTSHAVERVMMQTIRDFVRPGYQGFERAAKGMQEKSRQLCLAPDEANLEAARGAFDHLVRQWASVEVIRFGPVSEKNRFERILFYPDRKSTGLKQVQRILSKKDESVTDPQKLPGKSVAVQGLGALEFLLFGTGSEMLAESDAFRCNYARTVSGNLVSIAGELRGGWEKGGAATNIWTRPGVDNPVIRTPLEAVNELLGTLVHGLEAIRDLRIGVFLKREAAKDRPRVAIFRRSGNTMPVIAENIAAIRQLLISSRAVDLLEGEDRFIVDTVLFELEQAERVAREINGPIAETLRDLVKRKRVEYLKSSLNFTISTLDQDFASAAGLSSGFSFSDGD